MFDILIRGGSVADGTGRPAFAADVAVSGRRIAAVGDLRGASAAQVWDASGKTVTPGFIDIHRHADAALLRACENSTEVAATSLYSITRLLNDPQDIYIAMRAEPRENYSDTYTASKEETTNEENTLLAKGGKADKADLKYFRHLYNLRWADNWASGQSAADYTLAAQSLEPLLCLGKLGSVMPAGKEGDGAALGQVLFR